MNGYFSRRKLSASNIRNEIRKKGERQNFRTIAPLEANRSNKRKIVHFMAILWSEKMEKRNQERARRHIFVLINHFLGEEGLLETAASLSEELHFDVNNYSVCDNVDLPLIFMDFCNYYQVLDPTLYMAKKV